MDRSIFNKTEWDLLRAAPFNVQLLVSQADGDRELDEIEPIVEILMVYKGDSLIEDLFTDAIEAVEEDRLNKDSREALDELEAAIKIITNSFEKNLINLQTKEEFLTQLLNIAEDTATADIEGLEPQEESIIKLIKSKIK